MIVGSGGHATGDRAGGMPAPLNPARGGDPLLSARDLEKYYPVTSGVLNRRVGDVKAVDGVSFDLYPGETLAVVGESGCGKSTLARTVLGLEGITDGEVYFDGRSMSDRSAKELRAMRREVQMIFQDPFSSLNERMTVGRIVREPLEIHDERAGEREEWVRELLSSVGLDPDDHYDRFPHELSGGQRQRVAIARALALNPSVLIADEPVSALDVSIQAQILKLLEDLQEEYDLTYLFISHDLSVVRHIADHVAVMYLGRIVETADTETLFDSSAHPYTEALLSDIPRIGGAADRVEHIELEGTPPDPIDPPAGCNFHPRCQLKGSLSPDEQGRCESEDPRVDESLDHPVACHFRPEDDPGGRTERG